MTRAARRFLGENGIEPLPDPLGALWQHVAEIRAYYVFLRDQVGEVPVDEWERRDAKSSSQLSVYVELLERAQDRTLKALGELVKLGVEERLVKVTEAQGRAIIRVLDGVFAEMNLTSEQQAVAVEAVPRHLELVSGGGTSDEAHRPVPGS